MERDRVITWRHLNAIRRVLRRSFAAAQAFEKQDGLIRQLTQTAIESRVDIHCIYFPRPVFLRSLLTASSFSSIRRKVAGVAMGLILGSEAAGGGEKLEPIVLTDILGSEDALGDMDFKVAGDAEGITAFQMDIKVEGITIDVMKTALEEAQKGIVHVLGEMDKCNPPPAGQASKYAPRILSIPVPEKFFGKVIGKGGETIRSIMEKTGAENIDVNKEKEMVFVSGGGDADLDAAIAMIEGMIVEPEIGRTYRNCEVKKIVEFGCFVEYLPGLEGLVHISELDVARVPNVADVTSEGALIDVKVIEINSRGQTRLSRKEVLLEENPEAGAAAAVATGADGGQERSERRGGGRGGGRG